jgi:hypothetical protein
MPTLNSIGTCEFPDIVIASVLVVETGPDTVTFILDLRKCKVDFCGNTGYIETSNI